MGTETSTSSSPSLGEIITIIQRCLDRISEIIRQALSFFQDVLEVFSLALSSAAREFQLPRLGTDMDGMTPDASSAVLPDYLFPDTTLRSSPSTSLRRPAASTLLTNSSVDRLESRSWQHVMSITHDPTTATCRQYSTQYTEAINRLMMRCAPGTMTYR